MKCPRCQQDNPAHARFCLGCGIHLALACGSCGAELPGGARFCLRCGQAVAAGTAAPVRSPAPETYTPKHLAEKILTSKAALEGERKQVTVLFADLKGSMELLADRDPEEARKILDPVLELMMEAVHRYEGTVNQVMGDGIMALFGAPLAHEDHAVRACYAALRMQEWVRRYAEEGRRISGLPIAIRVGLNSGEVVVRSIGSDLRMDYTAVGQTTHLAARMEQMATAGSIFMTADVMRLAEGYVQIEPRGRVPVKGLMEPVEIYEVTGAGSVRSRLQASVGRGLTQFVGREAELVQLRYALEQARAGHGRAVAVVGEPGVGKSRLFWEFAHSQRTEGWLILEATSASYGRATPYLPVLDLLKRYFRIEARDDPQKVREKVTGKLLSLDHMLEGSLPALLSLLDVLTDDAQWERLDPAQRRQQTLDAVKRLLLRESQVQPLLLVVEDLHWIDSETQSLLDSLVESLPTRRVLLLVSYRPEYELRWSGKSYCAQLRLDPLQPESADALLRALLGEDAALQPLTRLLLERTEGNPFFLEESVRALVEVKVLIGQRKAYRLAVALPTIQVPATVQAVLAVRIDRLPPEEKRLLQSAAVVGKDVPFPVVKAIAELPDEELRRGLAHLQAAEFLYETRLFPDVEYTFKHSLTHDVAYGSLLSDRRRRLHARIVETIETSYPDRLAEHVDRLAHHALRGEVWDKALVYLRQAGARAVACSANREAAKYFEQALDILTHVPEGRSRLEQAFDLQMYRETSYWTLGELRRVLNHLGEAEVLARALDDQGRMARVAILMLVCLAVMGDQPRAIESGERGLAIAEVAGNVPLQISATVLLGFAHIGLGNFRAAIDLVRKSGVFVQDQPIHRRLGQIGLPAVFWRVWLMVPLGELGEFPEARGHGEEAVRIAQAAAQPYSLALAQWAMGHLSCVEGGPSLGIPALEQSVAMCRDYDLVVISPMVTCSLGYAYAVSGRIAEALPLMERAVAHAASLGALWWQSRRLTCLGEGYLLAGRVNDAGQAAERALAFADTHGERANRAYALRLLGEVAIRGESPDSQSTEHHLREALALVQELGMRPLAAHCHLGLGKLYRRTGKRGQAHEHITTATTMYREMNMQFWLEQGQAEMTECSGMAPT